MVMRENNGSEQIAILEDGILVEHYVSEQAESSIVGNVYLGKVQNVLPGMEAAFVDIGVGRNGVLYAGEVNWDVSGLVDGEPKRIEHALKKNDIVMVQVTKDPVNLKGARLTSQVTFAGRYLVLVPSEVITGISKKLPDRERTRLKAIISDYITNDVGIIVRTAAQGVKEEDIIADIKRLKAKWEGIEKKAKNSKAPALLYEESDMAKQVIREQFSDEFSEIIVAGNEMHDSIKSYIGDTIPELSDRVTKWTKNTDIFKEYRIDEQLTKAFDRKVWLPSGGTLVIDRTEAMTIVDVNTGKFTGNSKNATLEQTVTFNNLEAAEEIVRQLRLRDIGGIVIIDFIDMILPDNRNKVLQRLLECLSRDRTKHQVAEITSLGLVQLTRKRVGQGLIEAFSTVCEQCAGKGYIIHSEPVKKDINSAISVETPEGWYDRIIGGSHELDDGTLIAKLDIDEEKREANKNAMAAMAQAAGLDSNSSSSADESEKEVEDGSAEVADNISTESEE
jgi:ribonuclease E